MIRSPEEERLVDAFSTHWKKYVIPTVAYVLLSSLALVFFLWAGLAIVETEAVATVSFFAGMILLLIVHHWFFHAIMSESMVDVLITTRRFILMKDRLLFSEDVHEITLDRIRAVEARERGFIQNILHYGSLWFDTGGSDISSRIISDIPNPHEKASLILKILQMK